MTTTNTIRRFEISNINTGVVFGVYEGRNEGEALDAYAADAGYASFGEACEVSWTDMEDIAAEEVDAAQIEADEVIEAIKTADSLDNLKAAIIRYNGLSRDAKARADMKFSFDNLPTFGEDYIEEAECEGVFSWDRTRLLVLDGSHVEIRDRVIKNTVDGFEIAVECGCESRGTISPYINSLLEGDLSSPDHSDPAILSRVAALAQKLGLKMVNPDAQFFCMSEEEQVFVDPSDGLLILTSGEWVAWEAAIIPDVEGDDNGND